MAAQKLIDPPRPHTADGKLRRIGVEIEFAGLDCRAAVELVCQQFGGDIKPLDDYRYEVTTAADETFVVELDSQFVHPDEKTGTETSQEDLRAKLEQGLRSFIGEVSQLYVPVEIVCPPFTLSRLTELDQLIERLRQAGASGTRDSVVYAFGLQLNPELPGLNANTILAYLQAYAVLADWLRQDIGVDLSRRLAPFIAPFPRRYVRKILMSDYTPDMAALIEDYMEDNPTRNRELDMLPLFLWLDEDRVFKHISDPLLKPRPTLHYRLPDCRIDDPQWNVTTEWNRWSSSVERLASDPARLRKSCDAYMRHLDEDRLMEWVENAVNWLQP